MGFRNSVNETFQPHDPKMSGVKMLSHNKKLFKRRIAEQFRVHINIRTEFPALIHFANQFIFFIGFFSIIIRKHFTDGSNAVFCQILLELSVDMKQLVLCKIHILIHRRFHGCRLKQKPTRCAIRHLHDLSALRLYQRINASLF